MRKCGLWTAPEKIVCVMDPRNPRLWTNQIQKIKIYNKNNNNNKNEDEPWYKLGNAPVALVWRAQHSYKMDIM